MFIVAQDILLACCSLPKRTLTAVDIAHALAAIAKASFSPRLLLTRFRPQTPGALCPCTYPPPGQS